MTAATPSAAVPRSAVPRSAVDSTTRRQQAATQPPVAPLTLLGDADAEACVDGVCEVPARD